MIIGEAPGMSEDIEGLPFVGPAGQKEDEILKSQGWDPNQDFYWTN
ncbi:MAG: uracil-DNA glycosylase family protein, partial [Patescibacteria group bacterium]